MKSFILICLLFSVVMFISCEKLNDPDESGNLVPKTTDEDPLLPYLEINGVKLHTETFGNIENPVIIFLNGGPGVDYRGFISEKDIENASRYPDERIIKNGGLCNLSDEYFCVFFDQRGAGLSPRFDQGKLSFDLLVDDLDAIVDHFLEQKYNVTSVRDSTVILFGHSFGGVLATGYTNEYPDKVKDIITYEPGPFTKEALDKLNMTSPFAMIGQPKLDEWLGTLNHLTADDHARADYQQALGAGRFQPEFHENPDLPFWRIGAYMSQDIDDFGSVIADDNLVKNLASYHGRFLFMFGEFVGDEFPGYGDLQISYYNYGSLLEIPGTGHSGPWEKSDLVVKEIRNFLE